MSLLTLPASLIAQDKLQTDTTGSSGGYIILFLLSTLIIQYGLQLHHYSLAEIAVVNPDLIILDDWLTPWS